jgi:hypothetical protein
MAVCVESGKEFEVFDVPTITLADYEARIVRETERIQQILPRYSQTCFRRRRAIAKQPTPPSRSAVVCIEDNATFSTTKQAAAQYGTTPNSIRQSIYLGLSAAGKHWRRVGREPKRSIPLKKMIAVQSPQLGQFPSVWRAAKRVKQSGLDGSVSSICKRITNCLQHGRPLGGTDFTFMEVHSAT